MNQRRFISFAAAISLIISDITPLLGAAPVPAVAVPKTFGVQTLSLEGLSAQHSLTGGWCRTWAQLRHLVLTGSRRLLTPYGLPVESMDYPLQAHFRAGRFEPRGLLERLFPSFSFHASQWIAVQLCLQDLVGLARTTTDKQEVSALKEKADRVAQDLQNEIARVLGITLVHYSFETKGEIDGGTEALARTGHWAGHLLALISDVIENTTAFAKGLPGSNVVMLEGPAAAAYGSFPDRARAMLVVAPYKKNALESALRDYHVDRLEELLNPLLDPAELARRIARMNNVGTDQLEITVLSNEKDLEAKVLRRMENPPTVHNIDSGTVRPAKAAGLARSDPSKKILVQMGRSGMTEALAQVVETAMLGEGRIALMAPVSARIKDARQDFKVWDPDVVKELVRLRELTGFQDAEEIVAGTKVFSSSSAQGLRGRSLYTFLTKGNEDQHWPLSIPGVAEEGTSGYFTVHSVEVVRRKGESTAIVRHIVSTYSVRSWWHRLLDPLMEARRSVIRQLAAPTVALLKSV